ncbi:MAG: hypothetical protein KDJ14_07660 [Xanthomonadales bacterium]|nr:hypothetical protein [Xanthomonadales bacterium]
MALASYLESQAALAGSARTAPAQAMPWALARYVAGAAPEPGLVDTMRTDLGLYRLYRELLANRSQAISPRQAAAASDAPSAERSGQGFRLEFRSSRATPGQVYATVVLEGVEAGERALQVHVLGQEALLRLDFPAPVDGRSQRLFPADSPELALLRRTDSELVLVTL